MSLSPGALQLAGVHCAWQPYHRGQPAEPQVRHWLSAQLHMPAPAIALPRDRHGRPWLDAGHGQHDTSWSHSGEGLLMALGQHVRLGCDLEWLRPRPRALELARRYFTPDEADWLERLDSTTRDQTFVAIWCAKEAVLKAHGRGLVFGLHRLAFAMRDGHLALVACDPELGAPADWTIHGFSPAPGYLASLAWRRC